MFCAPLIGVLLGGCSTVGYYAQLAHGEYALLDARKPIAQLIADPATPAPLKQRLQLAQRARAFASDHLDEPRNGSYTEYADLHRPYAVWNVFATPEFSVDAVENCFPIAGCVAYRGYFDKTGAEAEAQRLKRDGDDVAVVGVPTYSTLGWFDDPVLSTMMRWDNDELAGEIFHELAHQKIYVAGDTRFNESYANFVERTGLRQWRATQDLPPHKDNAQTRADQFAQLMLTTRADLKRLYQIKLPADMMRARKADAFVQLHQRYLKLRNEQWHGYAGYDGFFKHPLNNASLLPFGLYDQWLPGFAALYAQAGDDWPRFFAKVKKLANEDKSVRDATMRKLTKASSPESVGAANSPVCRRQAGDKPGAGLHTAENGSEAV